MKLFKTGLIKTISLLMIVTLMTGIVGCKKNTDNDDGKPDIGGDVSDTTSLVDDLPRDESGNFDVTLLENVQLNLWSVIGNPDQETLLNLVKEFNKEYAGMIEIKVTSVGHYDYYNALDSTYAND